MTQLATLASVILFVVGGVIAVTIAAIRAGRLLTERRRARRAARPRQLLFAYVASGDPAKLTELARMPAADWRAVAPSAFQLLTKVRGEAHEALATLLARRGLVHQARRELRSVSAVRRARSAAALGSLHDGASVPQLCRLLADTHPEVRVAAIQALGRIGDPAAARPLLSSLEPPQPAPSQLVAHALAQLGPRIAPMLLPALNGPPLVQTTVLDAMRLIGTFEGEGGLAGRVPARVAAVLQDDHSQPVRLRAAKTLGRLGSGAAMAPLLASTQPAEPAPLRAAAAAALGELGAVDAVTQLAELLPCGDDHVAGAAATALSRLGPAGLAALNRAAATPATANGPARRGAEHANAVLDRMARSAAAREPAPAPEREVLRS